MTETTVIMILSYPFSNSKRTVMTGNKIEKHSDNGYKNGSNKVETCNDDYTFVEILANK